MQYESYILGGTCIYFRFQRISGITYLQVFGHIFEKIQGNLDWDWD